jgi:hypothetical protein
MNNNLDNLIFPYLNSVLDNFISNLEESLKLKGTLSEEEKKEFTSLLSEILEITNGYEDLISVNIKNKITNINHLLLKNNVIYEGEEHPLNTTPLSDAQEN